MPENSNRLSTRTIDSEGSRKSENDYNKIIQKVNEHKKEKRDNDDISVHPSYTRFQLPYPIQCRNRYKAAKVIYEQQFQYEISQLLTQQSSGYEVARLNRHLCITTLWPPLHNHEEIDYTQRTFFNLSPKQQKRLKWLMSTKVL